MQIRTFVLALCLACMAACAGCGGNSGGSPPPPQPQTSLSIVAPADNSTVSGPVNIDVSATNVSDTSQVRVLLNGSDVTGELSISGDTWSGTVQPPEINYGKNQIQVRYQDLRANSSFIVDTASGGSGELGAMAQTFLVPITTRVLRNNDPMTTTNWGIQVGSTTYWANPTVNCSNGPCNQGFQILLLDRQGLGMVSKTSYNVASPPDIYSYSPFIMALDSAVANTPGCGRAGCIMVIQSLYRVGYAGCYFNSQISQDCANYSSDVQHEANDLTMLGATDIVLYLNDQSANVGYSFIGNAGSGSTPYNKGGAQYERAGCSDTRYQNSVAICDSLGPFSPSQNSPTAPAMIGAVSGVLIRDNYNSFTYSPNAPQISYTIATSSLAGQVTNAVSINGSTMEGNGLYVMQLPQTSRGGFRLLMLDATDPSGTSCRSCSSGAKQFDQFFDIDSGIPGLITALTNGGTGIGGNSLVFLVSLGDIGHSDEDTKFSPMWDALAQAVSQIGGDDLTFKIVGDNHPAFNADKRDDYLLAGRAQPNVYTNTPLPLNAPETGYAIRRHTAVNAVSPTSVEGVLVQDQEGYYFPRLQGTLQNMVPPQVTSLTSASLQLPVSWPFSSTQGQQNAYTWISQQLCCSDIRASYINLNVSPENWLTELEQLSYPSSQSGSFSQADFDDVKGQLATEFQYVTVVRNLQSNILALYESQQSNVALILQEAQDAVLADIYQGNEPPPQHPDAWRILTTDVFPIAEDLAGFLGNYGNAIKTALGVGTVLINNTVDRTNDASGNSQLIISLADQEIAASNLAQYAINQYTDSLVTLGNDFNRVLSDWGRLRTVAGPIVSGQLQWDSTAGGYFLRAFNLTARRQFYPTLMAGNPFFFVTHIQYGDYQYYGSDDRNVYNTTDTCTQSEFHNGQDNGGFYNGDDLRGTAWYPGVIQSSKGDGANPGAYWWNIWALGETPDTNDQCPLPSYGMLPNTFGMFDPVDQNNPSALGLWKPYFFQRAGLKPILHQNEYFNNVP